MSNQAASLCSRTLIPVMLILLPSCGGKESRQAQPAREQEVAARSKSSFVPPAQEAVNTALVEGTFIEFEDGGQGVIAVTGLRASGAGTPAIAVGDSLRFQLDANDGIEISAIRRFASKGETVTMTLKYLKVMAFGQSASGRWMLIDLKE